jgi:hypothetical protein
MPRRGDYQYNFPAQETNESTAPRIGIRLVRAVRQSGTTREITFDPSEFRCARLAGELADEWVAYTEISRVSDKSAAHGRRAIQHFCTTADLLLGENAHRATMTRERPDIATVLAEWERTLPSSFRAGSTTPAAYAGVVRAYIGRRAQHGQRPVTQNLLRLVDGAIGVPWGNSQELDEFSRADKRALVRAGWAGAHQLEDRLTTGWASAGQGRDPAQYGWTDTTNLLWGLANQRISPRDISTNLPVVSDWPAELRACIERSDRPLVPGLAKIVLARWLVSQLYPTHRDLHAYRVLLVAGTGHAPEEVTALTEGDVEFLPSGVRLTLTKRRAQHLRYRTFGTLTPVDGEGVEFTDRPHHEVAAIIQHLMRVTARARTRIGNADGRLFVAASITQAFELRLAPWAPNKERSGFVDWLTALGVTVTGAPDIRRLRKSTKVEKAIAFGGRIADVADDHHEQVFRGHYAQGTTLRMMSGRVITAAQKHWFTTALEGPTVLTSSTDVLDAPDHVAALGLTEQQAEDIRRGALDMGVTECSDPRNSPYGQPGELCPVAPLRCLECRNAWVLPSNLPQLLLFADHLDRLRLRLSPQHFAQMWGKSHANLQAILDEHPDTEKALARKQIDNSEVGLHLPLSANVEFDT